MKQPPLTPVGRWYHSLVIKKQDQQPKLILLLLMDMDWGGEVLA